MAVIHSLFRRAVSLHMAQIPAGRLAKKDPQQCGFFFIAYTPAAARDRAAFAKFDTIKNITAANVP